MYIENVQNRLPRHQNWVVGLKREREIEGEEEYLKPAKIGSRIDTLAF